MQKSFRFRKNRSGFTLLELMLVVVILSAVAFMITGSVSDNISQVRYEDTRNRLDAIRTAILGPNGSAMWERGIQSGYVVDNGRLPENINALVITPDDYQPFGAYVPYFDPTPTGEFSNGSGDETPLDYPEHQLMKGHRDYYLPVSTEGKFRDGWGTVDDDSIDDDDNHGWFVDTMSGFDVTSYGMDGQSGQLTDDLYEADMSMSQPLSATDWNTDIDGAPVTLKNTTAVDLSSKSFKIALLVYVNGDANEDGLANESLNEISSKYHAKESWRCITSTTINPLSLSAKSEQTVNLNFSTSANTEVPIGEHLLVLLDDSSTPDPDLSSITGNSSPDYVTKRVKFFSRGGVPDMVLEIR